MSVWLLIHGSSSNGSSSNSSSSNCSSCNSSSSNGSSSHGSSSMVAFSSLAGILGDCSTVRSLPVPFSSLFLFFCSSGD